MKKNTNQFFQIFLFFFFTNHCLLSQNSFLRTSPIADTLATHSYCGLSAAYLKSLTKDSLKKSLVSTLKIAKDINGTAPIPAASCGHFNNRY